MSRKEFQEMLKTNLETAKWIVSALEKAVIDGDYCLLPGIQCTLKDLNVLVKCIDDDMKRGDLI